MISQLTPIGYDLRFAPFVGDELACWEYVESLTSHQWSPEQRLFAAVLASAADDLRREHRDWDFDDPRKRCIPCTAAKWVQGAHAKFTLLDVCLGLGLDPQMIQDGLLDYVTRHPRQIRSISRTRVQGRAAPSRS